MADTQTTTITREQFLAMKPATFLKDGFRNPSGQPRPELTSIWATAGAVQMEAVPPKELATVIETLRQVIPLHEGAPSERLLNACEESAEVAGGVLGKPVSPDLMAWLKSYAPLLRSGQDVDDLLRHLNAVAQQHAMFAGLKAGR